MIKIPIKPEYVEWAKQITAKFDAQKTYNKLDTSNNYIGPLGELVFHKWLKRIEVPHEWVNFNKQGWDKPDFIIAGKSIDLKTTFDTKLWAQKAEHDYYILARVNPDLKELILIGFIGKDRLARYINKKEYTVEREGRKDTAIPIHKLVDISEIFEVLGVEPKWN